MKYWEETWLMVQRLFLSFDFLILSFTAVSIYFYFKPFNLVKDLTDVGYTHLYQKYSNYKRRTDIVQQYRKCRPLGDIPPVYPNGWFVLLDSEDLKLREVKHIIALGKNFAVFRGDDKKVHITDAYCPHLGANIAIGGTVSGNCIQCPFHGWKFSGHNGKCVSIPYSDKVPENGHLKKYHSCEVNRLIFVWYHAEDTEPIWYPEPIFEIQNGTWWYRGRNEYYVNSHIQEIPENGADITHLSILHGPFVFAGSDLNSMNHPWLRFAKHTWKAEWNPCMEHGKEHIGIMKLYSDTVFFQTFRFFKMDVLTKQIGPGYVEMNIDTSMGSMKILQYVTPVEPVLQKVVHKMYYPLCMSLYGTLTFFTERILFERDVVIWNHKTYKCNPSLTKEESSIIKHRRWYNRFYCSKSVRFEYSKETLDW